MSSRHQILRGAHAAGVPGAPVGTATDQKKAYASTDPSSRVDANASPACCAGGEFSHTTAAAASGLLNTCHVFAAAPAWALVACVAFGSCCFFAILHFFLC